LFNNLDKARMPVKYLANLFSVGNEEVIRRILRKIYAVRIYMRRKTVEQNIDEATLGALTEAGTTPEEAEAIYRLTTLPTVPERFVLPAYHREMSVETWNDPLAHKGEVGVGYMQLPSEVTDGHPDPAGRSISLPPSRLDRTIGGRSGE
jgi:nitrate reductase / nitrite oxidoreductase, beta subunit